MITTGRRVIGRWDDSRQCYIFSLIVVVIVAVMMLHENTGLFACSDLIGRRRRMMMHSCLYHFFEQWCALIRLMLLLLLLFGIAIVRNKRLSKSVIWFVQNAGGCLLKQATRWAVYHMMIIVIGRWRRSDAVSLKLRIADNHIVLAIPWLLLLMLSRRSVIERQ